MNKNTRSVLLITILSLIWGSSFILMKWGLQVYTPFQIGAIRMFVSFLCLFPFVITSFRKIESSRWKYLLAAGLLGNGIPSVLFPLAETNISSALAGMINSLTPVFTLLFGIFLFRMKAGAYRVLGVLTGLAGAVILVSARSGNVANPGNPDYAWYVVIATLCYAGSVNILKSKLSMIGSVPNSGFAIMFVGVPMGAWLFSTDFLERTMNVPGAGFSLTCIVVLALFGTALSTVLFNMLIKSSGALFASSVTYLIPIVATLWGLWDHESIGVFHIAGLGAVLSGIYLINKK